MRGKEYLVSRAMIKIDMGAGVNSDELRLVELGEYETDLAVFKMVGVIDEVVRVDVILRARGDLGVKYGQERRVWAGRDIVIKNLVIE